MERKHFLATAATMGAVLATAGAALAAPVPTTTGAPVPGSTMHPRPGTNNNWKRTDKGSNHNIHQIRKHLEHVIDELQHDQHDYAGHRQRALDLLNQARQELLAAEQADKATNH